MKAEKKTVPIDEELIRSIQIATKLDEEQEGHFRWVTVASSLQWLLKQFETSKQFTPEQREELNKLRVTCEQYLH